MANKREHHHVFFLITRSNTSERLADPGTMVEWLRALAVVQRRRRHNVTWDAYSKYVGGAGRAGWGALHGVEAPNFYGSQNWGPLHV